MVKLTVAGCWSLVAPGSDRAAEREAGHGGEQAPLRNAADVEVLARQLRFSFSTDPAL